MVVFYFRMHHASRCRELVSNGVCANEPKNHKPLFCTYKLTVTLYSSQRRPNEENQGCNSRHVIAEHQENGGEFTTEDLDVR